MTPSPQREGLAMMIRTGLPIPLWSSFPLNDVQPGTWNRPDNFTLPEKLLHRTHPVTTRVRLGLVDSFADNVPHDGRVTTARRSEHGVMSKYRSSTVRLSPKIAPVRLANRPPHGGDGG